MRVGASATLDFGTQELVVIVASVRTRTVRNRLHLAWYQMISVPQKILLELLFLNLVFMLQPFQILDLFLGQICLVW